MRRYSERLTHYLWYRCQLNSRQNVNRLLALVDGFKRWSKPIPRLQRSCGEFVDFQYLDSSDLVRGHIPEKVNLRVGWFSEFSICGFPESYAERVELRLQGYLNNFCRETGSCEVPGSTKQSFNI